MQELQQKPWAHSALCHPRASRPRPEPQPCVSSLDSTHVWVCLLSSQKGLFLACGKGAESQLPDSRQEGASQTARPAVPTWHSSLSLHSQAQSWPPPEKLHLGLHPQEPREQSLSEQQAVSVDKGPGAGGRGSRRSVSARGQERRGSPERTWSRWPRPGWCANSLNPYGPWGDTDQSWARRKRQRP